MKIQSASKGENISHANLVGSNGKVQRREEAHSLSLDSTAALPPLTAPPMKLRLTGPSLRLSVSAHVSQPTLLERASEQGSKPPCIMILSALLTGRRDLILGFRNSS